MEEVELECDRSGKRESKLSPREESEFIMKSVSESETMCVYCYKYKSEFSALAALRYNVPDSKNSTNTYLIVT